MSQQKKNQVPELEIEDIAEKVVSGEYDFAKLMTEWFEGKVEFRSKKNV